MGVLAQLCPCGAEAAHRRGDWPATETNMLVTHSSPRGWRGSATPTYGYPRWLGRVRRTPTRRTSGGRGTTIWPPPTAERRTEHGDRTAPVRTECGASYDAGRRWRSSIRGRWRPDLLRDSGGCRRSQLRWRPDHGRRRLAVVSIRHPAMGAHQCLQDPTTDPGVCDRDDATPASTQAAPARSGRLVGERCLVQPPPASRSIASAERIRVATEPRRVVRWAPPSRPLRPVRGTDRHRCCQGRQPALRRDDRFQPWAGRGRARAWLGPCDARCPHRRQLARRPCPPGARPRRLVERRWSQGEHGGHTRPSGRPDGA